MVSDKNAGDLPV